MIEAFGVMILIVVAIVIVIKFFKNKQTLIKSILEVLFPLLIIWVNTPCTTIIPNEVEIPICWYNLNFILYEVGGWIYIVVATIIVGVLTYYTNYTWKKKLMSSKEINKEFNNFVDDAKKLYCIGNKLTFLDASKKQRDKIFSLKDKCQILCTSPTDINTYYELYNDQVNIRLSTEDNPFSDIRGQIKVDGSGINSLLFVKKIKEDTYEKITINKDNNIVDIIMGKFNQEFEKARNPLISCIALDLGGVYFDGELKNFFNKIKDICGNVEDSYEDSLNLDPELSEGKIDIITFLERKCNKKIKKNDIDRIKNLWNHNWKPNNKIKCIMDYLYNELNIKIVPFSNLDKSNYDYYLKNKYFNSFSTNGYFSCNSGISKPNEDFFIKLQTEEKLQPYQILLIDDMEGKINMAKKLNWHTISFTNVDKESSYKDLIKQLLSKNVINSVDFEKIEESLKSDKVSATQ